jgi:hypothetical protein
MQRYIKDSGISIMTHFASHQNDHLNFPLTFGVGPVGTYVQQWKIKPPYMEKALTLKAMGTGSHWYH